MMETYCGECWREVVIPGEVMPKPDPRSLQLALTSFSGEISGGLYVGDTGDDLDVVLNYRNVRRSGDPEILAVSLVYPREVALYQQRGADFIISHITNITRCLPDASLPLI